MVAACVRNHSYIALPERYYSRDHTVSAGKC
jgi:hypothetical protein